MSLATGFAYIRPLTVLYIQQWNVVFTFVIFVWVVGSEETLFSICSKILQQCVEHVAVIFWNTDVVDWILQVVSSCSDLTLPNATRTWYCWWIMVPVNPICSEFLQEVLWWISSLNPSYNSFCVPTKFFPLSDRMDLTAPLLAMNLLSARMKELMSKAFVTFICITRQVKHVNNAPYLFNSDLLSLMR